MAPPIALALVEDRPRAGDDAVDGETIGGLGVEFRLRRSGEASCKLKEKRGSFCKLRGMEDGGFGLWHGRSSRRGGEKGHEGDSRVSREI